MPSIRGEIGGRVRVARRLAELCARELAEQLGRNASTVYRWEYGLRTPSFEDLEAVARITRVDLAWLLTGQGEARLCA